MVNFLRKVIAPIFRLFGGALRHLERSMPPGQPQKRLSEPKRSGTAEPAPPPVEMPLWVAVNVIAASASQFVPGKSRTLPTPEKLRQAWQIVGEPLGAYLRACLHLRLDLPVFVLGVEPVGARENPNIPWFVENKIKWIFDTGLLPVREIEIVIDAIWRGAMLRAYRELEDVLARRVEHALRGLPPVVRYENGPPAKRECYVRDSVRKRLHPHGRVIVARAYEHGEGGEIEILDAGGGTLSRQTLGQSGWSLHDGWIVSGGSPRLTTRRDEDEETVAAETLNPPTPKI